MTIHADDLRTTGDIADAAGVTQRSVQHWLADGHIRPLTVLPSGTALFTARYVRRLVRFVRAHRKGAVRHFHELEQAPVQRPTVQA